ncbi:MFS transporter [Microbacterium album]|uniref:MFS transporter n=1 Tax=Microbacterium album TaxID=2053191 RepID=A0A917IHR0_9MICO|nr:aromatic acid/H+ symport family MFS transporter [Microbacterium album]GGH48342.1 MFS transporter [Microbacterium album]
MSAASAVTPGRSAPVKRRSVYGVLAICWATIVADGYDLISYGSVLPDLLQYREWGLDAAAAGRLGSLALVGMLIGALVMGTLTDRLGRRRVMIACLIWFSVFMPLTGLAPTPEIFGALRFVTGLGLGGVVPTAIALTIEYSAPSRRHLHNAIMYSGYSAGGLAAALLAMVVLPAAGFRMMFFIGAAPLVLIVPFAIAFLPESVSYLVARGRIDEARRYAERYGLPMPDDVEVAAAQRQDRFASVRMLFSRGYRVATPMFWAISLIGLLLVYGLNTWLPEVMRSSGYSLGTALAFLLVFNLGAIVGVITAGALADRIGERVIICASFLAAAASVTLLSARPPEIILFALIAIAGFGANTQTLVNAFVGGYYPPTARATALGWALAVGRIGGIIGPVYGGLVLTAVETGLFPAAMNFYAFALPAVLAAVAVAFVPRRQPSPSGSSPAA